MEHLYTADDKKRGKLIRYYRIKQGLTQADLARKLGVAGPDGKLMLNEDMSTYVPGFFAAGDCTGGLLQVAKAVSDGAIAGTAAGKFLRGKK